MNFLTPLFLIGGLAIAGPVIFHLIRRATRARTKFSSLMFLLPTPPRLSKRSNLQHILILLLRCLALGLLALSFARPFFRQTPLVDPSSPPPNRTVVLVDVSASMRRAGLWSAARERVAAVLRRAAPTDQVAIYTFDRQAVPLASFEEWGRTPAGYRVELGSGRLAAKTPGWSGTHLGTALITAAEALAENDGKRALGRRQIVLISDLQAGSRLDALQAYEWPKGVELVVEPVKASNPTNAGLQLVADATEAPRTANAVVRFRVTNASDSLREQFQVGWARADGAPGFVDTLVDVYVPPGQSRIATISVPKDAAGLNRLVLRGDDEDFDNTAYLVPPTPQRVNILWLGAGAANDPRQPLFFLNRALADVPRYSVRIVAHAAGDVVPPNEVNDAAVIFVSDLLPADLAGSLHAAARAGKTIVFTPKSADAAPTLAALAGVGHVALTETKPANYAMLAEIDFQHPLFLPFADPKFSDFTKIHFWKYRKIDPADMPGARVVASFDNGAPALVEVAIGSGRLLVWASGWEPDDSQLAVSSKFVPLMLSLLELSGATNATPTQWSIGDSLPRPAGDAVTLRGPTGPAVAMSGPVTLTEPGIYELDVGAPQSVARFAVNLDPNESRTAALGIDELERLGVPVSQPTKTVAATAEKTALFQATEAENRQKLWRWLIAAVLGVLLVESVVAGWTARRQNFKPEETPT